MQSIQTTPQIKIKERIRNQISNTVDYIRGNTTYFRKHIIIAFMICITAFVGLTFFLGFCDYTKASGSYSDHMNDMSTLTKFLISWVDDIFGSTSVNDISNKVNIVYSNSSIKIGSIVLSSQITTVIKTMHNVFKNFSVMLLVMYFLAGLMEELSFNQMYIEKMVKKFVFLCIGIVLINKSLDVVYGLANVGTALSNKITSVATSNTASYDALKQYIYEETEGSFGSGFKNWLKTSMHNLAGQISFVLQLFIPWVISKICYVMVQVTCWARFFEITMMAVMSPIAFAEIGKGSIEHGGTMRMVKNLIALSLTGAMIIMICFLCTQVQGNIIETTAVNGDNFGTAVWQAIIISVAQMGLVQRSTEIVKSSMGMV